MGRPATKNTGARATKKSEIRPRASRQTKKITERRGPDNINPQPKPKHPGGRPPKYSDPEELSRKIEEYFDSCWEDKVTEVTSPDGTVTMSTVHYQDRPYTMMGLAVALGFTGRKQLWDYSNKPEFSDAIKKARAKVEGCVEERLLDSKNAAGAIFWLKNNAEAKYADKQELAVEGAMTINVIRYGGADGQQP